MRDPVLIFSIVGVGVFFLLLASLILLRVTLGRRLDSLLKQRGTYWHCGTLDFGFFNTMIFAWAVVVPNFDKQTKFKAMFGDFNVRSHTRWFECFLAYIMVSSFVLFMFTAIFFSLTDWLGVIDWEP